MSLPSAHQDFEIKSIMSNYYFFSIFRATKREIRHVGFREEGTFERASEIEDVLGDRDDFGADSIAGEQDDGVAPFRCVGGAADCGEFGGLLGYRIGAELLESEWSQIESQRSSHGRFTNAQNSVPVETLEKLAIGYSP